MREIPESGGMPPEGGPSQQAAPKSFAFHGQRKTLAWMVFKYGILTLLTLGIYRFWAKTHLRRYLWGATEFDGDRFEWHGTVKELFIGFLIALAVLLPLAIIDGLLRTALVGSPGALAVYSFVYLALVLFLINFAFYRMWRYRMTRTSWRSIRFNMRGSAAKYALSAILWSIATGLTLGIAYPWMQAALVRRRLNETEIGGTTVQCDLRGGQLFPRFILCFVLSILALVLPVLAVVGMSAGMALGVGAAPIEQALVGLGTGGIGVLLAAPFLLSIMLYYRVFAYRKMMETTNVGTVSVAASIRVRPLVWSALITGFLTILVLALPFAGSVFLALSADAIGNAPGAAGVSIAMSIGMLSTLLVMPLISAISMAGFVFTALSSFIQGTTVENPAALDEIVQNTGPAPKTGEGFADALDVGAF